MRAPDSERRPQLFALGRAGDQARRAAGVQELGPGSAFNERRDPVTKFKSARRLVRSMLRAQGCSSSMLSAATREWDKGRRRALGMKPRVRR